jgi:hypothetical protein
MVSLCLDGFLLAVDGTDDAGRRVSSVYRA